MGNTTVRAKQEAARARKALRLLYASEDGLLEAIDQNGGTLTGVSVRMAVDDCLMTLRAERGGVKEVSFVGGETLAGVILKAVREAKAGTMRWREDKWD